MVASMRNVRIWAALTGRSRGRRRNGDERGAVLIEALIVIPILMMITLGIIEYGGAYREDSTVAAATRAGARVASALSKSDFGVTSAGTDGGIVTANAVAAVLQSLGAQAPQQLWIYRVEPLNSSCGPPAFTGCAYKVGYGWNSTTKLFNTTELSTSGSWPATKQYACASGANLVGGTGPDQIGVWVTVNHTAVTHMFGTGRALTGKTVMRLEPNVTSSCGTS
jgi:hypothetical protein